MPHSRSPRVQWCCSVWADHANAISELYSGTGALKTDFTRTGKRTKAGLLQDGWRSVKRYFIQNVADGRNQDMWDFFMSRCVDGRRSLPVLCLFPYLGPCRGSCARLGVHPHVFGVASCVWLPQLHPRSVRPSCAAQSSAGAHHRWLPEEAGAVLLGARCPVRHIRCSSQYVGFTIGCGCGCGCGFACVCVRGRACGADLTVLPHVCALQRIRTCPVCVSASRWPSWCSLS